MTKESTSCPFLDLEIELKACPHCGYHTARLFYNANQSKYFVFCEICHAMTAPDKYKDFAVANWNERRKESKRLPMYDKLRPCVFELGKYCCYIDLSVYTKQMCEKCRKEKSDD